MPLPTNIAPRSILVGKGIPYCILDEGSLEKEITYKECKRIDRVYTSCGSSILAKKETCKNPAYCNTYGTLSHQNLLDLPRYINKGSKVINYIRDNQLRIDIRIVDHPDIPSGSYTVHSTNDSNVMGKFKTSPPYYPH